MFNNKNIHSYDTVQRSIDKLRAAYPEDAEVPFAYTSKCIKYVESSYEIGVWMKEHICWAHQISEYELACFLGDYMVRVFGGKWCFEAGPRADNSRLKVLLQGKIYYPEEIVDEAIRAKDDGNIGRFIDGFSRVDNKCIPVDFK